MFEKFALFSSLDAQWEDLSNGVSIVVATLVVVEVLLFECKGQTLSLLEAEKSVDKGLIDTLCKNERHIQKQKLQHTLPELKDNINNWWRRLAEVRIDRWSGRLLTKVAQTTKHEKESLGWKIGKETDMSRKGKTHSLIHSLTYSRKETVVETNVSPLGLYQRLALDADEAPRVKRSSPL